MIELKTGPWNLTDLDRIEKNGRKVFSIFHCGGGSTMGYKLAGYEVMGGVEIDPEMMAIYRRNHNPRFSYLEGVAEFNQRTDIPGELRNIDILDGSPPCSSFSMAGSREKAWGENKKFREGQAHQVLDDLFFHFIETARRLKPSVVVAENVKGLLLGKAKGYVKQIIEGFNSIGYDTQIFLLNSAFMGVPQRRERSFFIARKRSLNWPKIEMNFTEEPIPFSMIDQGPGESRRPVPKSLIGAGKWLEQQNLDEVVEWNRRCNAKDTMFTQKMALRNLPVKTQTASGRHIYPGSDFFLSDREVALAQTFPQDFDYLGVDPAYLIGMSVPPFMMQRVANEIRKQWFGRIQTRK